MDSLTPEEHVVDNDDERIRLLLCYLCDTIEPLPWFDGPPEYDDTLNARLEKHRTPEGHPHVGNMCTVSEKSWNDPGRREGIIAELEKSRNGGEVGLGTKFYNVRDTYSEESMKCWRFKHNRTDNCEDFRSDKMRVLADTREERKDLGLSTKAKDRPGGAYICDFCPMTSIMMIKSRKAKGIY